MLGARALRANASAAGSAAGAPGLGPLHGIRILDLTRVLAGPFATQILGDMGADIVKIEAPHGGDETRQWGPPFCGGESAYFLGLNRNKRSVAVNLKSPAGAELVRAMALKADVMIENFVPGKAAELGIGYEALAAANPRLVYCSLSGYGASGPDADRMGYDVIVSAEGGLMGITGERGGNPVKCGVALTDVSTGLFLHGAILAALFARTNTGRGQRIETSLLETQVGHARFLFCFGFSYIGLLEHLISFRIFYTLGPFQASILVNAASAYLNGGVDGQRWGTAHPSIVPYQAFATADGHILIAAGNDGQFRRLCARMRAALPCDQSAAQKPLLADDPRYATNAVRVKNRQGAVSLWILI
jgi:succinate--hydroxymethylglutarate CoA-transferase